MLRGLESDQAVHDFNAPRDLRGSQFAGGETGLKATISKGSRVVIVGAGPAGLSTAHYLTERGYSDVLVLEKEQRVGGLCKSLTVGGKSFDLGANFVTKAYTEVWALAKKLDAKTYSEKPFAVMDTHGGEGPVRYASLFEFVREKPGGKIPLSHFSLAVLKFMWLRWKLRKVIDRPDFSGVAAHPELCVTFERWLKDQPVLGKDLNYYLSGLFQVPITMMGYGQLNVTAAPYVLKFMTLATFWPMVLKSIPWIGRWLTRYPKRFEFGFQRLWQRLAWGLDVRLGIQIEDIARPDDGGRIRIRFSQRDQNLAAEREETDEILADALILACPLRPDVLDKFLTLEDDERSLFEQIGFNDYCMTTRQVEDMGDDLEKAMNASAPLMCVFPEKPVDMGQPWAVAQARDDIDFVQFYTRVESGLSFEEARKVAFDGVERLLAQMRLAPEGGKYGKPNKETPLDDSWHTFDRWLYFQNVKPEAFGDGWYDDLAALQGRHRTFYVGGATNFELIEPIMEHSKGLVLGHFPGKPLPKPFPWKTVLLTLAAVLVALAVIYLPPKQVPLAMPNSKTAAATTNAFWTTFHADDYNDLSTRLDELEAAHHANPTDHVITSLLAAGHLWRFQGRRRNGETAKSLRRHLDKGRDYAQKTLLLSPRGTDVPSTFAPAVLAIAKWHSARLDGDAEMKASVQVDVLLNTKSVPEFDGYVQGWLMSSFLHVDDPHYRYADEGYNALLEACAGFTPSADTVFSKPILAFLALKAIVEPSLAVCYANPIAPHNLEGYFLALGDHQVKQGDFKLAEITYKNAALMPTYPTWPYAYVLEGRMGPPVLKDLTPAEKQLRLAGFERLQKIFKSQTDLIDVPRVPGHEKVNTPADPVMSLQSGMGCSSCHAK
jgi:Flavin containing amine oxidoreductase